MRRTSTSGQLGRYFVHGIFFSILMSVMLLAWAFIFGLLVFFGFIIGLVIGFALLFIIIGAINAFVTENVWDVKMQTALSTDLVHGLVLFLILLIVSFPVSIVLGYLVPAMDLNSSLIRLIFQMILLAFVDGYIAKGVAGSFELATRSL